MEKHPQLIDRLNSFVTEAIAAAVAYAILTIGLGGVKCL